MKRTTQPPLSVRAVMVTLLILPVLPLLAQRTGEGVAEPSVRPDFAAVIAATARRAGDATWTISAKVLHNDEGWDHYADAWEVRDAATDELLGTRELLHPHVTEMPFTRSLSGVTMTAETTTLRIRARCNVHGYGGDEFVLVLER